MMRWAGRGVLLHCCATSPSISRRVGEGDGALCSAAHGPFAGRPSPWMLAGLGDGAGVDTDGDEPQSTRESIIMKERDLENVTLRLEDNETKLDAGGLTADKQRRLESNRALMTEAEEHVSTAPEDGIMEH